MALYTVPGGVDKPPAQQAIAAAFQRGAANPNVLAAVGLPNTGASQFVSKDGKRTFAVFTLKGDDAARIAATDELEKQLRADGVTTEWTAMDPAALPDAMRARHPVCWNCHVAETFRRTHPELVTDR